MAAVAHRRDRPLLACERDGIPLAEARGKTLGTPDRLSVQKQEVVEDGRRVQRCGSCRSYSHEVSVGAWPGGRHPPFEGSPGSAIRRCHS